MKTRLLLAGIAAIGMLAACGDDDNNNNTPVPENTNQSNRPWQNIQVTAECNEATDPGDVCNQGAASLMFNWDGTFNFNNGQRTGQLSPEDLNRLAAAADPIASQDVVQQQACEDSDGDVVLAHTISIAMTANPATPVVVYEERDNTDEVCARGNVERLEDFRALLGELALKYAPQTSPSPSPTASPSPSPSPQPTSSPFPMPTVNP